MARMANAVDLRVVTADAPEADLEPGRGHGDQIGCRAMGRPPRDKSLGMGAS
jgi:hypothetical protein